MQHLTLLNKIVIILLALVLNNNAQAFDKEQTLLANFEKLSKHKINIACDKKAQAQMNKGVWLNQHKMYAKAEKTYLQMIEKHPDCAMAHWGYAVTLLQPRWSKSISQGNLTKGSAALKIAITLKTKTNREMDNITLAYSFALQLMNNTVNNSYVAKISTK